MRTPSPKTATRAAIVRAKRWKLEAFCFSRIAWRSSVRRISPESSQLRQLGEPIGIGEPQYSHVRWGMASVLRGVAEREQA